MMDLSDDKVVFGDEDVEKAQDLHTIFWMLLEEYLTIQENGFCWDLFYKGQLYKDIKFVPYASISSSVTQTKLIDWRVNIYLRTAI
jgi:hypothetical protein